MQACSGLFFLLTNSARVNSLLKWVQAFPARQRHLGIERCNDWIGHAVAKLDPHSLVDVGMLLMAIRR